MEDKKLVYADFARRAKEKIEARKKMKTKVLYVPDMDMNITIRGVSDQELIDVQEYSEDSIKNDKYLIYLACEEVREIAQIMFTQGDIQEYVEAVDMFSRADRNKIANEILTLSGINDESTIKEVEEVKN